VACVVAKFQPPKLSPQSDLLRRAASRWALVWSVQAMTAEMNMNLAKGEEDKLEITSLRKEVYEWKQKYFDCRRKMVPA